MAARAGLSTESVVAAAGAIADEQGVAGLTLARLAERLGVKPPSLYNHVDGLGGVRRAVARDTTRRLADELRRAAAGRSADDALKAIAHAYRAFGRAHPGRYEVLIPAPEPSDQEGQAAAGEVLEVVLAVLRGYRLDGDEALHAARALRSALHGFTSLEIAGGFGLPLDLDMSFARLIDMIAEGLADGR